MDEKQKQIQDIILNTPEAAMNPMGYVRAAVQGIGKVQLNRSISLSGLPGLKSKTRTLITGDSDAALMVIMDYPAEAQAQLNKPINMFEGIESIERFIRSCFESHDVNFNKIVFMNTVPYCPSKTLEDGTEVYRTPSKKEIEACQAFVRYAVDLFHPPMLLLMGNVATNVYIRKTISKIRGQWQSVHCIPTMPTYSPNELAGYRKACPERAEIMLGEFKQDIANAMAEYKRHWPNSQLFIK